MRRWPNSEPPRGFRESHDEPFRIPSYGPDDNPPDRPTFDEVIAALNAKGIHQVGLALGEGSLVDMRKVAAGTDALQLQAPEQEEFARTPLPVDARVRRRDRLGGLLHEYYEAAA